MNAYLILEDESVYVGKSVGSKKTVISEVVFNTSMTGYLEVLTDPSYAGQAVVMTYPLIGNYGINHQDMESKRPWPDAFIVREISDIHSNFRSEESLIDFLVKNDIPGISGIDTRDLTKRLREHGTMNGMLTTDSNYNLKEVVEQLKKYNVTGVVEATTCMEKYEIKGATVKDVSDDAKLNGTGFHVALIDLGAKKNIARELANRGCDICVWPASTKAEEIIRSHPDGIMLSNGPGDPKENTSVISEIKKLYDTDIPIFAICLGHQLMALATGMDTYKLKYGHRGGNHPVKDLKTGRVYISSQNHGYAVDTATIDPTVATPAFTNVNDETNEGLYYIGKNIMTVQYHPEACPGPRDSSYLFDRFIDMMGGKTDAKR